MRVQSYKKMKEKLIFMQIKDVTDKKTVLLPTKKIKI